MARLRLRNIAGHVVAGGYSSGGGVALRSEPAGAAASVDPAKFREANEMWGAGREGGGEVCALTAQQVATYNERGWVTPEQFRVAPDVVQRIKDDHERFVHRYLGTHPEFADYCGAILNYDLAFLEYCRDPDILNMVSQCIGPDIALWNSSFFAKPPETGRRVPWHQDGQYWAIRPLASCTVWLAIDDATVENGCLRMIPGSHAGRALLPHTTFHDPQNLALAEKTDDVDESLAEDLLLEAGQISLHDIFLVHGSEPNRSSKPRRGMTMRYMPTTSLYDREIAKQDYGSNVPAGGYGHTLFLMRGVDHAGNDYQMHNRMA